MRFFVVLIILLLSFSCKPSTLTPEELAKNATKFCSAELNSVKKAYCVIGSMIIQCQELKDSKKSFPKVCERFLEFSENDNTSK